MAARNFNNVTTAGTLSSGINAADATCAVANFTGNPTAPFTITLDRNTASEEICLVTLVVGSTLTITRGYNGTAAQSHSAGATVEHTAVALDFTEANDHINSSSDVHGTTGELVGAEGAQTLLDKTLTSPVCEADVAAGDGIVVSIPSGAEARNMIRGVTSGGSNAFTVNSTGQVTAARVHSTGQLEADGNTTLDGTLTVAGATTIGGNTAVTGTVTASSTVTGSTVTATGQVNAATADIDGATATGNLTVTGTATVSGNATLNGTLSVAGAVTAATVPTNTGHLVNKTYADNLGDETATANTIARRTTSGRLVVGTPTSSTDAATKAYVDSVDARMQCGEDSISLSSSNNDTGTVTFPVAFSSTPVVVITPEVFGGSSVDLTAVILTAPTTTGFGWRVRERGGNSVSVSGSLHWIAMVN